jgi:hypothetical protein
MDGPLGLTEATWLDEHLAGCPACSTLARAYEDDRLALRALRDQMPDPPRDLWARTAAAIEAEWAASSDAAPRPGRLGGLPIGALSGLAVVAVVVGVSLLSGSVSIYSGSGGGVTGEGSGGGPETASEAPGSGSVEPTPFAVGAGPVGWIDQGPNGGITHHVEIDEVCPVKAAAGCPDLRETRETALAYQGSPRSLIGSPSRRQAVAIAKTADAQGDEVVVVALPDGTDQPAPSAAPASETAAPETASPSPDAASIAPSARVETEPPVQASASPTLTAEPTIAAQVAIASGIDVVGESAAYSPDGTWFAFTARPADGSGGPDVYVWRVGDEKAARVTDDGASYFASWSGNELIASRPDDRQAEDPRPVTVLIDPATRAEGDAGDLWRPAVDPTGRLAIAWDGSLQRADGDASWSPDKGTLELRRWSEDGPARADGPERSRVVTDEATADFDVRWDETGEWVAIWVADARDPAIGRLSLYRVDRERGRLEEVDGAPIDASALPGFSMGDGRLAWATPPGQGGEGSRIQIAAWSATGVGIVESGPGEQLVVIR